MLCISFTKTPLNSFELCHILTNYTRFLRSKHIGAGQFTAGPGNTKIQVIDSKKYNTYNVHSAETTADKEEEMKKTAIILSVILTAALVFTGCAGSTAAGVANDAPSEAAAAEKADVPAKNTKPEKATEATAEAQEDEQQTEPEEAASSGEITYSLSTREYDSDYENFSGQITTISVTDENHKALKDAVDSFYKEMSDSYDKVCAEYVEEAKTANEEAASSGDDDLYTMYYSYDISGTVTRADDKLFSICISEYSFTGGAHGETYTYGVNFDPKTGEKLSYEAFGDISDSVKSFILKDIDASGNMAEEMLFPEYKETIDEMFETGMKDKSFWFDNDRLIFAFQQYDIAPYASGIMEFHIPYSDIEGFNTDYLPAEGSDFLYCRIENPAIAEMLDINDDGKEESIYLESKESGDNNYYSEFTLHVDDTATKLDIEDCYYGSLSIVKGKAGNYLFVTATSDNDWNQIFMYDAGTLKQLDNLDGSITDAKDGVMTIASRAYVFGTWSVNKDYNYGPDGFKVIDEAGWINNGSASGYPTPITLLQDLEYHEKPGGIGEAKTLKKGSKIYPVSLSDTEMGFETESGERGYFGYYNDEQTGRLMVNGIDEEDMFKDMPYAG